MTVPGRLGLETVDILRLGGGVGPVLHNLTGDTVGFLVAAGTGARWNLLGSVCVPLHGWSRRLAAVPPLPGASWLVPPDAAQGESTDSGRLRHALATAARTLAAVHALGAPGRPD
ncbi:hypothetical protein GL263_17880 [Streptomyces durbertensis]|uniref:Uncharacterized protein n=1 Tax=Streptomyces durbertensis TaxID=2448886 RepID=A0ABR6EJA4_9ACTN|nr:hypothetical protein [Streptomyces durbertensis]